MTTIAVGERFTMSDDAKPVEIRDDRKRLLARYLPSFSYRVTGKNMEIAQDLIAKGKAQPGGKSLQERAAEAGINLTTADGKVKGRVRVGTSKKGDK